MSNLNTVGSEGVLKHPSYECGYPGCPCSTWTDEDWAKLEQCGCFADGLCTACELATEAVKTARYHALDCQGCGRRWYGPMDELYG